MHTTALLISPTDGRAAEIALPAGSQATIAVLLKLAVPDWLILLIAFSAGVVAALGQAAIPYFIGRYLYPAYCHLRTQGRNAAQASNTLTTHAWYLGSSLRY